MNREGMLLKDTVSPDRQAPSIVVFGKTAGRMDEVIRLFRDMGGVSAYGTFSEAEALQHIATVPRLGVVLLGGAIEEASRCRIRDELARNHPGVLTSEPGQQYPYSDENIVADVRTKLGAQGGSEGSPVSTSSSVPIIFYSPGACSLSCMVTADWVGEPYELCRVEREVRGSDAFKRINPRAQVPALRLADRTLVEAAAILVHLAERRAIADLLPASGTAERDTVNQWLSYLGSGFHVSFYPFFSPSRYIKDPAAHEAVKAAALEQIRTHLGLIDQQLAGRSHLLGAARSVLDPYLYAMSRWAVSMVDLPREYPNVAAHQERMQQDAAVQFALATERGESATSPSGACLGHINL